MNPNKGCTGERQDEIRETIVWGRFKDVWKVEILWEEGANKKMVNNECPRVRLNKSTSLYLDINTTDLSK